MSFSCVASGDWSSRGRRFACCARTSLHVEQLLHAEYVGTKESIDRAHAFGVDFLLKLVVVGKGAPASDQPCISVVFTLSMALMPATYARTHARTHAYLSTNAGEAQAEARC